MNTFNDSNGLQCYIACLIKLLTSSTNNIDVSIIIKNVISMLTCIILGFVL